MNNDFTPDVTKMSDTGLKQLKAKMDERLKSVAEHPEEEEVYETKSPDWQKEYQEISDEIARRGI